MARRFLALSASLLCSALFLPNLHAQDLTVGLSALSTSIDPQFYVGGANGALSRSVFDGLVNQDDKQKIVPALAISWKATDATTWVFYLRPDVTFHDGSAFAAADVVASIHRVALAAKNSPSSYLPYVADIAEVRAIDPLRVEIKTKQPAALLLNNLSRIAILPARLEKVGTEALSNKDIIGTGPFKFVSWTPNDQVILARNDHYWGGKAEWDHVTLKMYKNDSSRVAALLAGDTDLIENVPTSDRHRLSQQSQLATISVPGNRLLYLHPDQDRDKSPFVQASDGSNPLKKTDVRRAMSLAINRQLIIDRIYDGQGSVASQLMPQGYFGYQPAIAAPVYDPAKAKALLAQAGYPAGFTLTFQTSNDRYPNDARVAQALGQMFSRVGIKTSVETMPGSVYFSRAAKRDFSLVMGGAAIETGEASGILGPLLETFGPGAGQGNRGRYSNPEFDRLLQQARETLDDSQREKLLQQATSIAVQDQGVIPLLFLANTWTMKKGYHYDGRSDGFTLPYYVHK